MDLGVRVLGSESGHENGAPIQSETRSSFAKQDRSGFDGDDCWRSSKLARTEDLSVGYKTLSYHQGIPLLRSTPLVSSDPRRQEHMLSFSSSDKSEALDFSKDGGLNNKNSVSPYLQQFSSSYNRTGYGSGGMMNTSMHDSFAGLKGPFTLSQWAELEQQALIYKYITANVPIPSTLLLSLKKTLYPYGHGSLPSNSFGYGAFHLGYSGGSMDPEPGRCRRTDGKKWRCSRDAVPDQKYCERHINRGRHRSRKPVEGQSGHTAAAISATVPKVVTPAATVTSSSSLVARVSGSRASDSLTIGAHSTDSLVNRAQNSRGASIYHPTMKMQNKESPLVHMKQDNPFEFGIISSDSLLHGSQKSSYMNSDKGFGSYLDFSIPEKHSNNPNDVLWPDELKSDWTQLSMSIPMASPTSPAQEKLALSPLRLSREFDPAVQMGLGVDSEILEPIKKTNNWIPISWGNSLGGPLGEVLNSPKFGSSPTGVLQKSAFCSLSNSSSGNSPVRDNKKTDLCEDLLGSTLP